MTLTRAEFEAACKAFIFRNDLDNVFVNDLCLQRHLTGWTWNEHNSYPGLGYLSRSILLSAQSSLVHTTELEDFDDVVFEGEEDTVLSVNVPHAVNCQQYVVHSATFQVPVFYFSVYRSDGVALSLDEIRSTSLFRPLVLPGTQTPYGINAPESAFALLSQGDHPTIGTPCWYLHPCHTAEVVGEILDEAGVDGSKRSQQYLESWFMVLGNMITWA